MTIELRDELIDGLNLSPARLRLEIASGLFASEEVSLGQGAQIAGLSQSEFQRELGRRHISVHYDVKEFEEDLATLRELPPQ